MIQDAKDDLARGYQIRKNSEGLEVLSIDRKAYYKYYKLIKAAM